MIKTVRAAHWVFGHTYFGSKTTDFIEVRFGSLKITVTLKAVLRGTTSQYFFISTEIQERCLKNLGNEKILPITAR